jgi:hypothetical protein
MQTTVRENTNAVSLSGAANQFLNYRLKVLSGAGANFGWADDEETGILSHSDPLDLQDVKWQLKAGVAGGQVQLTVPQKATYTRTEAPGTPTAYALTLFFATAIKYTLTIDLCNADGTVAQPLVDIDYTRDLETDKAEQVLGVNL